MEDYMKQIFPNYKKYYAKILYPNTIGTTGKGICETEDCKKNYSRTRLSTNNSKLSIASLMIDKHISKDCPLVKYIGSPYITSIRPKGFGI